MKNILFDIRTAQTYHGRGVFRYCWDLVIHLAKHQTEKQKIFLLTDKRISKIDEKKCQKVNLAVIDLEDFDKKTQGITFDDWIIGTFVYFWLPQKWETITYTYPQNVLKKCNRIVGIIHDLIPVFYQEECLQTYERKINFALQFETLKLVDHYLCNSQYTMQVAQNLLKKPLSDFTCIYGSTDLEKWHNKNSDLPYNASDRKNNIVYVGGNIPRKNSMGLIRAFGTALKSEKIPNDAKLWLLSTDRTADMDLYLKENNLIDCVVFPGFISDNEMLNLVATARSSFFPSYYEGLGLPILESYAAGTPCFVANTTSTQEFARIQDSFNPENPNEISDFIINVFNNEEMCRDNLEFGRQILKKLTWDKIAEQIIALL
jgi:glycosyltransferase involved in cell wall biosynthesis